MLRAGVPAAGPRDMEEDEALPPPPPRAGERESREERAERLRREEIRYDCIRAPLQILPKIAGSRFFQRKTQLCFLAMY